MKALFLAALAFTSMAFAEVKRDQIDTSRMPQKVVLAIIDGKVARFDNPRPNTGYGYQAKDDSTVQLTVMGAGEFVTVRWSNVDGEFRGRLQTIIRANGKVAQVVLLDKDSDGVRESDQRLAERYVQEAFAKRN